MSEFVVSAENIDLTSWKMLLVNLLLLQHCNAINNNQVAQSFFLFCGPRGVGKTSCARIFAEIKITYSENEINDFSFNIFELDAASNNSVEDIESNRASKNTATIWKIQGLHH